MTIYAPDHDKECCYRVGDIFMIQHGPNVPNVFAWRVLRVNAAGHALETQPLLDLTEIKSEIDAFVERAAKTRSGPCTYDPRETAGMPIGMYHCPECGEMVLAGQVHPDYSIVEEMTPALEQFWERIKDLPEVEGLFGKPVTELPRQVACDLGRALNKAGIELPRVFPTFAGGVQLEWNDNGSPEIEIYPDGRLELLVTADATTMQLLVALLSPKRNGAGEQPHATRQPR